MSEHLIPDAERTVSCLSWLLGTTIVHIEYMPSVKPAAPKIGRFPANASENLISLISEMNGVARRFNMYWVPDGGNFKDGKRKKSNLERVDFLHVDLDFKDYPGTPEEQRARVEALLLDPNVRPKGVPEPTLVWETGGGYQALWKLKDSFSVELAERANLALLQMLEGGPGTHDPGRLIRLFGTTNWLNDKKRAAGREPAVGRIVLPETFDDPPKQYPIESFVLADEKLPTKQPKPSTAQRANAINVLPTKFTGDPLSVLPDDADWRAAIVNGKSPPKKQFASRSELLFGCTIWMASHQITDEDMLGILLEPSLAVGDHIRDRHKDEQAALRYAQRQVARARDKLEQSRRDWPVTGEKHLPVKNHPDNIRYAFAAQGITAHRNEFSHEDEIEGAALEGRDVTDIADILSSQFERRLQFKAAAAAIKREISALAHDNRFHPVKEYLSGLKWDGVQRIDTWLVVYCGVEDTPLHREFAAKTLIAAVRRIKQPGVKFDTMLVLEGQQGVGKSTVLKILAISEAWFCESLNLRGDEKQRAEILAKAWIAECQELDGLNKLGSENLKKFLSESTDTYRKPYEKHAQQYPRHCIIVGTTNESDYLRDITGNRRFWPVKVQRIDLAGVEAIRDQLWAEAVHREAEGEPIVLSEELWADAERAQRERLSEDPYADVLRTALGDGSGKVSMESVKILLQLPTSRLLQNDARRIRAVLSELGWRYGTYKFFSPVRGMRQTARGFMRGAEAGEVPELMAKRRQDGQVIVGYVDASGEMGSTGNVDADIPF